MKNNKHDHKLTKFLKATIFSIVMLAPLIAVGIKCAYVIKNENAYQSYSAVQSPNTYLSEDSVTTLTKDKIYQFTTDNQFYLADSSTINVSQLVMIKNNGNYTGLNKTAVSFAKYTNQNGYFIHIIYSDNSHDYLKYANTDYSYIGVIQFNFVPSSSTNTYNYTNWTKEVIFGTQQSLDNVFYYSIQELSERDIFNWTKNTMIYNAVNSMNNGLGVGTETLSILITYWSIITAIYIIMDIVIEMFIFLTHWANDKMA